jgi:ubiquinone/menaquinone biosynthesis C-methylase UbiE
VVKRNFTDRLRGEGSQFMASLFSGIAAGYATARPPVHALIIDRLRRYLAARQPVNTALDIGCGAGLSTRALRPVAARRIGIEPAEPMLSWSARLDPEADFVAGQAESLPLADASVDLITAAGSLNYVDLDRFFPEAVRVLRRPEVLAVYDFAQGTRCTRECGLEHWFSDFRRRYPPPAGGARALDPALLAGMESGFRMDAYESFEVAVPLTLSSYTDYILTEINVAAAVQRGECEAEIRRWCEETLSGVFQNSRRDVLFPSYLACMVPVR